MTQPTVSSQSVTAGGFTRTQLEVIRVFGRKELEFGCIFKYGDIYTRYCHRGISFHIVQKLNADTYAIGNEDFKKVEILGHIPEIFPDVARIAEERGWLLEIKFGLLTIHFKDRTYTSCKYDTIKPFLEQPESVLIELLNLFK